MIIEIAVSPITQEIGFLPKGPDEGYGFNLYDMLEQAGLNRNVRVACWDNYEDCVVFND